jgi:hypothetical protein
MLRRYRTLLLVVLCLSCSSLALPQPVFGEETLTLWKFLGIPQTMRHIRLQTLNRNGKFPGLEPKPPLRAIADPSHLPPPAGTSPGAAGAGQSAVASVSFRANQEAEGEEAPPPKKAIEVAAEIKKAEDEARQKIKALRYLAKVGCGCRPGVAEALMDAIDPKAECTEEVRYVAAQAITETIGNQCDTCNTNSCCTPELMEKMAESAFLRDERGCWREPSEKVREALQEALQKCCPWDAELMIVPAENGLDDREFRDARLSPMTDDAPPPLPGFLLESQGYPTRGAEGRIEIGDVPQVRPMSYSPSTRSPLLAGLSTARGIVLNLASVDETVTIDCPEDGLAIVGSVATVERQFLSGVDSIGTLQIVDADRGYLVARPKRMTRALKAGDQVVFFMQKH